MNIAKRAILCKYNVIHEANWALAFLEWLEKENSITLNRANLSMEPIDIEAELLKFARENIDTTNYLANKIGN